MIMILRNYRINKLPLLLAFIVLFVLGRPLVALAEIPTCSNYTDPAAERRCEERIYQKYGVTFLDQKRDLCKTAPSTTPPASKSLFIIGDSIGEGLTVPLNKTLGEKEDWKVSADTRVGRPLSEGASIIEKSPEKLQGIGVVLVVLGTNNVDSTTNQDDVGTMIKNIKAADSTAEIYWLKVNVTKSSLVPGAKSFNDILAANKDISVIDGQASVSGDGIHPSNYSDLANTVSAAVKGADSQANASTSTSSCGPCGANAVSGGSNNEETVFKFFAGNNFTKEQSAGIVGNMIAESGVNPKRVQGTSTPDGDKDSPPGGGGYGLVQWTPGTKILDDAKAKGQSPGDLNFQMGLLLDQLNGGSKIPEKAAGDDIKKQTTVDGAAKSFMLKYERPADKSEARQNERARLAEGVFQRYAATTAGSSSSTGTCSTGEGTGTVIDGFVVYDQLDERWANSPYGTSTVAKSGCGPSSVAMVVSTLVDKNVTPDVVAKDFSRFYKDGEGSDWGLMTEAPVKYGLKSNDIANNMEEAKKALREGKLIIASGKGSKPFTTDGHLLVLRGITDQGKLLIGDSGHKDTSDKEWDESVLAPLIRNMWVITK